MDGFGVGWMLFGLDGWCWADDIGVYDIGWMDWVTLACRLLLVSQEEPHGSLQRTIFGTP